MKSVLCNSHSETASLSHTGGEQGERAAFHFYVHATSLRPGDWLVLVLGLLLLAALVALRPDGVGDRVSIKLEGRTFLETDLRLDRVLSVPGPLGVTQVEIRAGRVRVKADPGPRQLCVKQGWLGPGEAALCLPNRVSVERGQAGYDSLNY